MGWRADVERVADRAGAQPHRVLDTRCERAERVVVGGDVGFAVDLQDQRDATGVLFVVFLRQTDVVGDSGEVAFDSQAQHPIGVERVGIIEEIDRTVLEALVDRQQHQGPVGGAVLVHHGVEPRALAGREVQVFEGRPSDRSKHPLIPHLRVSSWPRLRAGRTAPIVRRKRAGGNDGGR